jgi:acyl-CoA synthetase (NDP forming)
VVSHPGRYDTTFIPEYKLPKTPAGTSRTSCFISQSGAFIIANLSRIPWLDPAYALSIGNQIDVTAGDLLGFLKDDPDIEVVAVYMEGFRPGDGLAFAAAAREAVLLGKDVVFYKAGRTSEGRSATAGHTASVAGDYAVCAAALDQAGVLVAADFGEFSDLLNLCVHLRGRPLRGDRLAAVSNAGFEAVGMADSIKGTISGLRLVPFSAACATAISETLARRRLDGLVDVKNPLDVTPMADDRLFARIVEQVLDDDEVDLAVVGVVPLTPALQTLPPGADHGESIHHEDSIASLLQSAAATTTTPVVVVVDAGRLFDPLADRLQASGLPVFRNADRAVRALRRWARVKLGRSVRS